MRSWTKSDGSWRRPRGALEVPPDGRPDLPPTEAVTGDADRKTVCDPPGDVRAHRPVTRAPPRTRRHLWRRHNTSPQAYCTLHNPEVLGV